MGDLPWPLPEKRFCLPSNRHIWYDPTDPEVKRIAYNQALLRLLYSFHRPQEGERAWWFDKPRMLWVCGVYPIPAACVTVELVLSVLGPRPSTCSGRLSDADHGRPLDTGRKMRNRIDIFNRIVTRTAMKERRMQITKRREVLEEIAEMERNKHLTKWPGALQMNLDFARESLAQGGTVEQAEKYMARARRIYNDRPK